MLRTLFLAISVFLTWGCSAEDPTGTRFAHPEDPQTALAAVTHQPMPVLEPLTEALPESCDAPLFRAIMPSGAPYPIEPVVVAWLSSRGDLAYLTASRTLRVYRSQAVDWEVATRVGPAMAFDPTGRMLAFSSGSDPTDEDLYVADIEARSVRKLVEWPGPDTRPVFSPDGTRLAWVASVSGRPVWFVTGLTHSSPQPLFPSQFDWNPPAGTVAPALRRVLPVPVGPEPALWNADGLRFFTGEAVCTLEVPSGVAGCEGGVR